MKNNSICFLYFQKLDLNLRKVDLCFMLFVAATLISFESAAAGVTGNNYSLASPPQVRSARDPFTTSDKMYGELGAQAAQRASGSQGFIPGFGSFGSQVVPKMRLRGFVTKENKKAAALLDVEGVGIYLVSEGDELGLQAIGQNTVLKIIGVSANGVKVQSGQVNQVIMVR